nr:MAG TPA: hypothetical protein [Caudoviricetes sp.]
MSLQAVIIWLIFAIIDQKSRLIYRFYLLYREKDF